MWMLRRTANLSGMILMYHRILDKSEAGNMVQEGMYVAPKTFEGHIEFLKEYFTIVPLSHFITSRNDKKTCACKNVKPICALTFDDGWGDFYRNAYPIIIKNGIFACVFLPTGFIGTRDWFWTEQLAHLLHTMHTENIKILGKNIPSSDIVKTLETMTGSTDYRLERSIMLMKGLRKESTDEILTELSERWGIERMPPGSAFLTWEEIREMFRSGMVSFGSHTDKHHILTSLSYADVRNELIVSRDRLLGEGVVDPTFIPFAYPNGNYDKRIADMVKETGYNLAVTTRRGWIRDPVSQNAYLLNRISVHQDITSTKAMLACRILEIY
jgi:peptidoglycan/xylan/chitin deacetylase (PgdA/CDA1 family)